VYVGYARKAAVSRTGNKSEPTPSIKGVFTRSCCSVVSRWCQKAPVGIRGLSIFFDICRTLRRGGTRIRTGDTMIFSQMQKPLGMRKTRTAK
jgi:hypothetical protein